MSQRLFGFGKRLARDERGAVLIYVSIAMTVFMGFAALIIDGGRLFTLDTEVQSAADAISLAGAAELDGNADAWTRADAAMNNLVQNSETFGTDPAAIAGPTAYTRRFLEVLPDDDQPLSSVPDADDAASTRFVAVTVTDRPMDSMFATAIGGTATPDAGAVAVAGFTSAVCKFTPLFMCNPYEDIDDSYSYFSTQIQSTAGKRKIVELKRSGSGAKYAPGNFGFLQSIDDDTKFRESLGKVDPGACFEKDGVETKTGSTVSARQPLNTRFDVYDGSFKNPGKYKNNPDYRPARNVTKGTIAKNAGSVCKPDPDSTVPPATPIAMAFPVDSVIDSTTRMGNGDWGGKFDTYWSVNHPGVTKPPGWSSSDPPSRYDVYRWEIDSGNIPNNSTKTPKGENGKPKCSGQSDAVNDDPDRRLIYAAVLNCKAADLKGGSDKNIPALAFIKMFMTQPMTKEPGKADDDEGAASDNTLYVEMIDIVSPGTDDEVVHDIVQLYR